MEQPIYAARREAVLANMQENSLMVLFSLFPAAFSQRFPERQYLRFR